MEDAIRYYKLSAAVLRRGIKDLEAKDEWDRRTAWEWLERRSRAHPFGFDCLCDLFGLDADYIRELVREKGYRVTGYQQGARRV